MTWSLFFFRRAFSFGKSEPFKLKFHKAKKCLSFQYDKVYAHDTQQKGDNELQFITFNGSNF